MDRIDGRSGSCQQPDGTIGGQRFAERMRLVDAAKTASAAGNIVRGGGDSNAWSAFEAGRADEARELLADEILALLATGSPVPDSYEILARAIEDQAGESAFG